MAKYHVGVDVSKHKHKACIRNLSQDSYSGVLSFTVNLQGFEKFLATLEKLSTNKEDFLIGIEATGNYGVTLAYFLLRHDYKVMESNPYLANQFRKAQGKKAKTYAIDARSPAALLSLKNHKPLSIPDPVLDNLGELTRFRADSFPEFTTIFSQIDFPTSLALLIAYPGPKYIVSAGEEEVADTLAIASRSKVRRSLAKAVV